MGPTWGPPGSCRPQMGPMLATWTLLSGILWYLYVGFVPRLTPLMWDQMINDDKSKNQGSHNIECKESLMIPNIPRSSVGALSCVWIYLSLLHRDLTVKLMGKGLNFFSFSYAVPDTCKPTKTKASFCTSKQIIGPGCKIKDIQSA